MEKNKTRVKKAMKLALEQLDYIMDSYVAPDFVETRERRGVLIKSGDCNKFCVN